MILALLAVIVIYDDLMVTDDSKLYKCIVCQNVDRFLKILLNCKLSFDICNFYRNKH